MKRALRITTALAAMGLAFGFIAGPASAASTGGNGNKNYTCSQQGGGPNHKVTCIGTVNGNDVTVNVGDVNVLSDNQIVLLQNTLNNVDVDILNIDLAIKNIKTAVAGFYLTHVGKVINLSVIQVCAKGKCG